MVPDLEAHPSAAAEDADEEADRASHELRVGAGRSLT
jgi:hypothetical protein